MEPEGGPAKDKDSVTDAMSLSSASSYSNSAATSSAKTKDSLSEHVKAKGRAQDAQAEDGVPMTSNGPGLVLVSGHSGTGKTALVEDVLTYKSQSSKRRAKMIYLKGKFDLHKQHQQPYVSR